MPAQGLLIPLIDPTTVTVPPAGKISLVVNLSGLLTVIKSDGSINPISPTNQTSDESDASSVSANMNIGPGSGLHTASVVVTGLASVRTFSLVNVGLSELNAGWRIRVFFDLSVAVAGITLEVFDGNTLGTELFNYVTDGTQKSAYGDFYWTGTNWKAVGSAVPAINA
jgi:hypothetical protein